MLITGLTDSHFLLNPEFGDGGILGRTFATEDLPTGPAVMLEKMGDISVVVRHFFTAGQVRSDRNMFPPRCNSTQAQGVLHFLEGLQEARVPRKAGIAPTFRVTTPNCTRHL